ncbi:MAG: nitroreductase family protein [Oscillospiraceae bacterium]|nr:nitroreductase family protein [Oscillospiraceae bacterium]
MVNEVIKKRKSIRRYEEGAAVTDEQVRTILEAAMLAPSACNSRPWEFMVVRNREKLDAIVEVHPHTKMLKTASLAILVNADVDSQTGIAKGFFPQDCAAAVQNILLQSAELDLGTCWCGVYPKEELIEHVSRIFELPENIVPFGIIAVGVAAEEFGARGFYEEDKVKWVN